MSGILFGRSFRRNIIPFQVRCCTIHEATAANVQKVCFLPKENDEAIFRSILIANRGEIACRIIKTCRKLGIKTVAIYSDVDVREPHVSMADEAFHIGPAKLHDSYLNVPNIMKAIKESQAEAVHPGYGFLSENMNFVRYLENSNVTFIGPKSNAVKLMGDKLRSKRLALEAGVNMIPGMDEEIQDMEHCLKVAKLIGYPIMIKASAGGGGKGMRIAYEEKDIRDGFYLAKKEAFSYFGDDRILVEKYIPDARHIEMQVLCDKFGNAIYLHERDCSIQRRNQKIIEEAPSPFLDQILRRQMGEQACALARAAGYDSAGTVEFLVDSNRNFYFLEMNTRLQVEHAITEEITGIDLVCQMIRIAYGHKLSINQRDVPINGSSIECRIYAENSYRNFGLPCSGHISKYIEPLDVPGIRCDSGVTEGSQVSISYDPMICKLIATGEDRAQALERMRRALDMFVIRGLTTNVPLLRTIVSERNFRRGHFSTNYLPETFPNGFSSPALNARDYKVLAAVASYVYNQNEKRAFASQDSHLQSFIDLSLDISCKSGKSVESLNVTIENSVNSFKVSLNNELIHLGAISDNCSSIIQVLCDGIPATVQLVSKNFSGMYVFQYKGCLYSIQILPRIAKQLMKFMKPKKMENASSNILSPMPGLIKSVAAKIGECVAENDEVCVIEAMKMQNILCASKSGTIRKVHCKVGDIVDADAVLVEIE